MPRFLDRGIYLVASLAMWAIAAGVCIGGAEIGYLYLFGGIGGTKPMPANIAIPAIVSGTIVVTLLVSYLVFRESIAWNQLLGAACIVIGIAFLFGNGQAVA